MRTDRAWGYHTAQVLKSRAANDLNPAQTLASTHLERALATPSATSLRDLTSFSTVSAHSRWP